MFTELVAVFGFLLNVLKEREVLEGLLPNRGVDSVLQLYFLLDEIIEASKEHLRLARYGATPEVIAELEASNTFPFEQMLKQLETIAENTERFIKQLDAIENRLGIYLPEIPRKLKLRMFMKKAYIQWWIEVIEDEKTLHRLAHQLQSNVPQDKSGAFLVEEGTLYIPIYSDSTNPEYLSTKKLEAIHTGERNVAKLQILHAEFREFIKENFDIQQVF